VRFVVLDVELLLAHSSSAVSTHDGCRNDEDGSLYTGPKGGVSKYAMADVEVARESDFGVTDETFRVTTAHLGNLLQTGDVVLGYDLVTSVYDDEEVLSKSFNKGFVMPDVVLVKKAKVGVSDDVGDDGGSSTTNTAAATEEESKKERRAKSSGSKKRERRQRKYEKKAKALEEASIRMGFGGREEGDAGEEKATSQQKGRDDLEDELDAAEKLLEASQLS